MFGTESMTIAKMSMVMILSKASWKKCSNTKKSQRNEQYSNEISVLKIAVQNCSAYENDLFKCKIEETATTTSIKMFM